MNNRILLMNPPTKDEVSSFSLGLAYLSSVLRKNGFEVKVIDAAAPYNPVSEEYIKGVVRDFKPLFVGLTMTYDFISEKYKLARELKESGLPIVGGGPHVNLMPQEAIDNAFDVIVVGEGEETIIELARAMDKGTDLEDIDGLGLRKRNGEVVFTNPRKHIKDLDGIPFPDYEDFPVRNYIGHDDHTRHKTYFNVFTSRGCPHKCTFCSSSRVWGPFYRWRSAKNVFDEIAHLVDKYGAKQIAFQDNEPLVNKKRMYELCDLLRKSGIKVKISSRARIDNLDEDLLKNLMEVGFYKLAIGIESGDNETLKRTNRNYTVDDIISSVDMLDRINFPVIHFNNLVGFPWETTKHLDNTLKMNKQIPKSLKYFVDVVTPIPLPATPLYDEYYKEYGFKDWWLDPEKNIVAHNTDEEKPLYKFIMPILYVEFLDLDFWKYPRAIKNKILQMQLELQRIAYKKNSRISALELNFVMFLVKISIKLHRISPQAGENDFFFYYK